MEKKIVLTERELWIPVSLGKSGKKLEIFESGKKLLEFLIPTAEDKINDKSFDGYGGIALPDCVGKELLLKGDFSEAFMDAVHARGEPVENTEARPRFHMTAQTGWINDPNGLVYENGVYHYYFQYNPFDTEWGNMSWGHSVSSDLLHWSQKDTVLYPEEDGMIFSGSAVLNQQGLLGLPAEAIVYFYTVAGGIAEWSKEKAHVQKTAYSLDHGYTLIRHTEGRIEAVARENRDPKVFWHEESQAYIMIFWVENDEFILLRSQDLKEWKETQRFFAEDGFECPDLIRLSGEEVSIWVLLTAAGYYYPGDFDGYTFRWHGYKKELYADSMQYAAQTFSGINNRTVLIPWLKMKHTGRKYRGAGGLPRELSVLLEKDGTISIVQNPVREFDKQKIITGRNEGCSEIEIILEEDGAFTMELIFHEALEYIVEYRGKSKTLLMGEEPVPVRVNGGKLRFIFDDTILEAVLDEGRRMAAAELPAACTGAKLTQEKGIVSVTRYWLPE